MFLHASILHIVSNVLFLIFFGFILEEHFTKPKWIATFLITGLVGNITFAIAGVTGLLGPEGVCGVGASGAVYGIMGTALGWRATIVVIFLAGLDIFAGGGLFAHIGGLIAGFGIRHFWIIKKKEFD
jgi:membrane associated rhomboid family serine protease